MNRFKFVCTNNHMTKSTARQSSVSRPIISTDHAFRLDDVLDKRYQTIARCILQMSQSKSSHYFIIISLDYFYSNTNQCFPSSATSSFSGLRSAYICFIDLDDTAQSIPIRSHHSTAQFMQPLPCRMIASQTQKALQSKSISTIFLVCYMPHRTKPDWQRLTSSVQDSSRSLRSLCPTFCAMEQSPASLPYFLCLTLRTNKAIRPSQLPEILQAGGLGAKPFLKFHQCAWVIFLHMQEHYILWLLESSAYPGYLIADNGENNEEKEGDHFGHWIRIQPHHRFEDLNCPLHGVG